MGERIVEPDEWRKEKLYLAGRGEEMIKRGNQGRSKGSAMVEERKETRPGRMLNAS